MSFINNHQFTGRLGADPETTEGGLVTGRIAVRNPAKKGQDGKAGADWFAFKAFNGIGRTILERCKKGDQIGLSGSLSFDRWSDKETSEPRVRAVLLVEDLDLLETASTTKNSAEF